MKYKTKAELQVPVVLQDQNLEKEGRYTPDELKWDVRGVVSGFFNRHQVDSVETQIQNGEHLHTHKLAIKETKPDWVNHPLNSTVMAAVYPELNPEDPFFMSEIPDGPWAEIFESHKEILNLLEVEFDLIKERVRLKLSPTRYWITPIHTSVYQALNEHVMSILVAGKSVDALAKAFLPHVASVTFFIYKFEDIVI